MDKRFVSEMVENVVRKRQKICLRNGRKRWEKWTKDFRNGRKCCKKWTKDLPEKR